MVLEMNGDPVDGEGDLRRLQQLPEAEPPLCLTLAPRAPPGSEARIPPESAAVRKERQGFWGQSEQDRGESER